MAGDGGATQQTHDGAERDAFAGAGLADDADDLAGRDVEVDAVDGAHGAAARRELHAQAAHVQHQRFTSSRSAKPSPTRLKPMPHRTMAMPGNTLIHQACVKKFLPSAISTPHSAAGGCAPSPR